MVLGVTAAVACGGDVYEEDANGDMQRVPDDDGGSGSASGGGPQDCIPCQGGDCGLCTLEAGVNVHRCPGGTPPDIGKVCSQTGSIYHDPNGTSYVCWRCD